MKPSAYPLARSVVFRGFRAELIRQFGESQADAIWQEADAQLRELIRLYPDADSDIRMMILPAAALYRALSSTAPDQALPLLKAYGTKVGEKIARVIHTVTSIPGVPVLLWKNMPALMRRMSSPKKGYTRRIVSESDALVGVDILSCPLHDAAKAMGVPEAAMVVCAMDKAYMTGFRHIRYTRTTSVTEGDGCCDYRLAYDKTKQ